MSNVFVCIQLKKNELQIVGAGIDKKKASKRVDPAFPSLIFNMMKDPSQVYEEVGLWLADNDVVGVEANLLIKALFKYIHGMMEKEDAKI